MTRPTSSKLFLALDATWPPARFVNLPPWTLREGAGAEVVDGEDAGGAGAAPGEGDEECGAVEDVGAYFVEKAG